MRPAVMLCAAALAAGCGDDLRRQTITVALDPGGAGDAIPDDFLGLSYETSALLPDATGAHYFRADNQPLRALVATLGIATLRLGGNEADAGPLPSDDDIAAGLDFVAAAGVRLVYTLRLRTFDPSAAATTAAFVAARAPTLDCFSIGNEPGLYYPTGYAAYAADARAYVAAIGPGARYCGPDQFAFATDWLIAFAQDFAPDAVNAHFYLDNGVTVGAVPGREELLSDLGWRYQAAHDGFAPQVAALGLPYRISESNNFFNGGAPGASDTFASALWGVDYLHWWASHGAQGVNLHTGDHVSGATTSYALFQTAPGGYAIHPLAYGALAFALGGHGRVVPVAIDAAPGVTAYGVLAADGALWLTIVDKAHGDGAASIDVVIDAGRAIAGAQAWTLAAPGGDVSATDGVTLGGAAIGADGAWAGAPSAVEHTRDTAFVPVAPASAVVLRLD